MGGHPKTATVIGSVGRTGQRMTGGAADSSPLVPVVPGRWCWPSANLRHMLAKASGVVLGASERRRGRTLGLGLVQICFCTPLSAASTRLRRPRMDLHLTPERVLQTCPWPKHN